jgi:hypothetical protein
LSEIGAKTGIPQETARIGLRDAGVTTMRHGHPMFGPPSDELTGDVALLLGLRAGDGWISDTWGISLNSVDIRMVGIVFRLVKKVLQAKPFVTRNKGHATTIRSGKKQVREFLFRLGFPAGRKAGSVAVPSQLLSTSNQPVVGQFLRGVFSSDGCFSFRKRSAYCVLQASSMGFRDGFVSLASKVGFFFRSYNYVKELGKNKLPVYVAYMGKREDVERWMHLIGSISDTPWALPRMEAGVEKCKHFMRYCPKGRDAGVVEPGQKRPPALKTWDLSRS